MHFSPVRGPEINSPTPVTDVQVGIAELKVTAQPHRVITLGLGSCVGITLYDPFKKVGGLLHIMLPDSTQFSKITKPAKFADLGIPLLVSEIKRFGGNTRNLEVKMAGGAQMFTGMNEKFVLNIGERNILMARQVLKRLQLKIIAEEVGGNRGRTMILDTATGQVTIRTVGSQLKVI